MAGRFPLYTDADVHGPLIVALRERGFGPRARDLISNDQDMEAIAHRWLAQGRPFRGLIPWPQEHYKRIGYGALAAKIEALSEPFPHPVIHLKPGAITAP